MTLFRRFLSSLNTAVSGSKCDPDTWKYCSATSWLVLLEYSRNIRSAVFFLGIQKRISMEHLDTIVYESLTSGQISVI